MKNNISFRWQCTVAGLMFLFVMLINFNIHADGGPSYNIMPLHTINQINNDNSYFYLKVGEKNKQKIQVIRN